jgi:hypothetical protein
LKVTGLKIIFRWDAGAIKNLLQILSENMMGRKHWGVL